MLSGLFKGNGREKAPAVSTPEAIVQAFGSGTPMPEIARRLNVSYNDVYSELVRRGLHAPQSKRKKRTRGKSVGQEKRLLMNMSAALDFLKAHPGKKVLVSEVYRAAMDHFYKLGKPEILYVKFGTIMSRLASESQANPKGFDGIVKPGVTRGWYYFEPTPQEEPAQPVSDLYLEGLAGLRAEAIEIRKKIDSLINALCELTRDHSKS